jgi:beta-galactosidase
VNLIDALKGAFAAAVLALASTAAAQDVPFNEGWQFQRLGAGGSALSEVTLPHTTRIEPRIVNDQWQGLSVYRKSFAVPASWRGKTVLLRVEAAMNIASVSLNGRHLTTHLGGYLPFTIDLTRSLRFGADNQLVIRLDNRDNKITGPKPLKDLDFNTYGGLYRGVRLTVKPPVHLSDEMLENRVAGGGLLLTYPRVGSDLAEIQLQADVRNNGPRPVRTTITHQLYEGPQLMATSVGSVDVGAKALRRNRQKIRLTSPKLWSPQSPNLYRLVTLVQGQDGVVDRSERRIGVRNFAFSGNQLLINGRPTFLRGVNRHQEYPYVGYAISPNADYRDAKLIKEAGFDYVRLSHYPHSSAFMAAADELGLVLLDALPGWQFYNPDPRFREQVLKTCRDMIRRDRNHASVLAWECSLNETDMPKSFVTALNRAVHEELPGTQTWSAGWLPDGFDIYLQARQHRLKHYEKPDRPYIVSEYGDWEYYAENAGLNQTAWADLKQDERTSRQSLGAGEKRLLQQATNVQEAHNDNFQTPAFADGYWAMFDYNRGYADDLETSGTMSLERLPKFSYWFFRSQRDAIERYAHSESGPMVRIASYWTTESSPLIRVFSNAEEVELKLNGRSLGRLQPRRDEMSNRRRHPPFHFDAGQFVAGTLEATAFIGGKPVAKHRVDTPDEPQRLTVYLDDAGVAATAGDLIFARASIMDRRFRPVPISGQPVHFEASGDYEIVGDVTSTLESGTASALVRVKRSDPKGSVRVSGAQLSSRSPAAF